MARTDKKARFTALLHHVTADALIRSFYALKRQAAPGIDGVTWHQYEVGLDDRIADLLRRVQAGTYRATPVKRAFIPKPDGTQRPLGIAALEDKVVQHAVVTVLNAIYEVDFLGFSYGFRPGRSAHDARDALTVGLLGKKVNWVLDADIRGFFDTIGHEWLVKFIEHRIADRRIVRLIQKWLRAGVSENGQRSPTNVGTPQGAVASPLLANVYLHYVFDLWVHQWRQRNAKGDVVVVRYADDFVLGFQHRHEAERFLADLKERLETFGLALHPDKTRLIAFGRFAARDRQLRGEGKPETFDFLGFTHSCGRKYRSRSFLVKRKTAKKRLRTRLHAVKERLAVIRHRPIREQGAYAGPGVDGVFPVLRDPRQHPRAERVPGSGDPSLAPVASATKSAASSGLGPLRPAREALSSQTPCPASLSQRPLLRQTPEVGAGCGNPARPDLSGGLPARAVPTGTGAEDLPLEGRAPPGESYRITLIPDFKAQVSILPLNLLGNLRIRALTEKPRDSAA